jgi:hypothetical protein
VKLVVGMLAAPEIDTRPESTGAAASGTALALVGGALACRALVGGALTCRALAAGAQPAPTSSAVTVMATRGARLLWS